MSAPFYDPLKTYEENFKSGPYGDFANDEGCEVELKAQEQFLGHPVALPFGISAGPLINGKFVAAAFRKGFDICVYKTVRTRPHPCQAWPNVLGVKIKGDLTLEKAKGKLTATTDYSQPLSITNSFGVPSYPVDWWQEDMTKALESAGPKQLLIGSFQGTATGGSFTDYVEDYALAAKLVKETGVKVLEVNLSCPNEGKARLLCFDIEGVKKVVEAIKAEIGNTPLLLKLAYFESDAELKKLLAAVGKLAEGFSVINTIPAPVINEQGGEALPGRQMSGICGAAIKWAGLDMVGRLKQLRQEMELKFVIVGVGGVLNDEDFKAYRQAGAEAVMSATGAMWNPWLACEIKKAI